MSPIAVPLVTGHTPGLVALSVCLAALASHVALDLAGRTATSQGAAQRAWLVGGSLVMGAGIWSMHFVGMLAFRLHAGPAGHAHGAALLPLAYDVPTVIASIVVAVAASALALGVVRRGRLGTRALLGAGTLLGVAIAGMHYVGMAALRMPARLAWDLRLVAASLGVAVGAAIAALWLLTRLGEVRSVAERWARAGAAAVMGLAIAGMHYTAMAAARFAPPGAPASAGGLAAWLPTGGAPTDGHVLATGGLATAVAGAAVLILGVAAVGAAVDRRHRRQLARSRDALRASEARLRAIFDHAAIGIALHDDEGRILEVNRAYEQITGYGRAELLAMRASELSPPEEAEVTRAPVRALKDGTCERVAVEKRFRRKDGALRLCALTVSRVESLPGVEADAHGLVGMLQDVTEHRALEAQLVYRACHDLLTGLANRAHFHERVAEALARDAAAADARSVAILLIDLDGFKLVNDTAGHAAGDALLREVADRLRQATRGSDLVARLGGDEFAVLLGGVEGEADAVRAAERILASLGRPVRVAGTTAVIGASVGIARSQPTAGAPNNAPNHAPHDARTAADAPPDAMAPVEALLRDADLALYAAKARGRGQYAVFEPEMHAAVVERLALESALRRGLERGEFRLVYQPIVDLATGHLSGVEALVRWQHPTRGLVPPAAFIPLAEETGLIRALGRWVLEAACRQGAAWATHGATHDLTPFSVTVNVSGRQLQQATFVDEVAATLAATGFPPARLVLELTESTVIQHPEHARQQLVALKALGVRLAIDDFGTGYSALSYLRQFPIDVLKIDKSFVDRIAEGGQPAALAAAIVALGDALALRTVAEGVESEAQATALRAMGCPLAQGYLFSRPVSAGDLSTWLAGRGASTRRTPAASLAAPGLAAPERPTAAWGAPADGVLQGAAG